ncbi:MAG: TonB-dependent receptor [Bacteroidetes bacterium]|nr:TonB-dependent receptor [Bacteroidota bacterium]
MRKISLFTILTLGLFSAFGQQKSDTTNKTIQLEEVVLSANNLPADKRYIAQKIEVINARNIANSNTQNTGDLLNSTGKIFVQKSQQGGSSAVIRGFEASRILLVVDGVRMNNAIYRSGHLQNIITVDQNMLDRVEIMYGPSSAIYGSDALGGTIHLVSRSPELSGAAKFLTTGNVFARYSSANNEKTVHANASIGWKKIAWLQSYTYSDFDDMKMGDKYSSTYPDFGRRLQYIGKLNGADTILANNDDRTQKFSGYRQWDIMQKLLFKQSSKVSHLLNFQFSNTDDVPRYDRLQDTFTSGANKGRLRYAEWYYGPQKRLLAAYEFRAEKLGFIDDLKVNINYQDIEESRQQREYKRYDRFDSRVEKVKVWGGSVTARKNIGNSEITAGIDAQLNDVKSRATRSNFLTGAVAKLDTRYPDGKNKMNNFGVFIQHVYKFKNRKFIINDAVRFQQIMLKSNVEDNSFFKLPDTAVKQNYAAVTGNIGFIYNPVKNTSIRLSVSSGFRAPNLDDLAKIFESSSSAKQVVVPNANIKPEYTYNADLSVTQRIANRINIEVTGYYTIFRNGLLKAPYQLNGQDSIIYNGVKSQVLATQNVNKAYVYGLSAAIDASIGYGFSMSANVGYCEGRFKTDPNVLTTVYEKQSDGKYALVKKSVSSKPLDHIPPVTGRISLQYTKDIFNTEVYSLFNGAKYLDKYNPDGEDNAQYATVNGSPSWMTLNWKASVTVSSNLVVQAGIENILDRNYRYFASGFSAPGRNFIISFRASW